MQRHACFSASALVFALASGSFLLVAGPAAADVSVHEGEWEITTTLAMTGVPFQPPPSTHTQCMTKKDAVPQPKDQGNCQISTVKTDGKTVQWHIKCEKGPNQSLEGEGATTYNGDALEGHASFTLKSPRSPNPVQATQTIKGRRLGDCKK